MAQKIKTSVEIDGSLTTTGGVSAASYNGFNPTTDLRTINTTSPLQGGGNLTADRTLSILQATASQGGYLTSTDWSTFNSKQNALGFTPENVSNKSDSYTVSSSITYASTKALVDGLETKQPLLTNPITGTGTTNYLSKFTGSGTLGNSLIYDNGTSVGIGTSSPTFVLDVQAASSNVRVSSSIGTNRAYTQFTNTGGTFNVGLDSSTGAGLGTNAPYAGTIMHYGNYPIVIGTNATERVRISNSGNVGIGTTNPRSKLEVNSRAYINEIWTELGLWFGSFSEGAANSYIYSDGSNTGTQHMDFGVNFATRVRIADGGNVLIGTTTNNGTDKLQVNGSVIATTLKKSGGTSSQFLKADGSVDTNTYYLASNPSGYTSNAGTVTSVGGTGTVSGLTLTGTVTASGNLTLGGALSVTPSNFASQTANTVLAAPNGTAGTPTFRALVAADIPTLNQNTTGSAATLTTGRTIGMTGDVTWTSGSFNGSTNVTGTSTLASVGTAGTYTKVTTDAKGRVTSGTTLSATDIPDITLEKVPDAWVKRAVKAATTANITLSGTQTIDGIALVAGDRVLVKDQTTASQNGIYVVSATAWSRSADADTISELAGACVNVDSGTINGGMRFDTDLKTTDTLGTTAVSFYRVLDYLDLATANTANKVVLRDGTGNFSAGTITAALSGNATTATTLQTARTINGTSFNGSANITTSSWGTARTLTIGNTGKSVDGSANISWSLAEIGAQAALTNPITGTGTTNYLSKFTGSSTLGNSLIYDNGTNVSIGTTVDEGYKLDVYGSGRVIGSFTINSGTTPHLFFSSTRVSGTSGLIRDESNMIFQKTEVGGGFRFLNSSSSILLSIDAGGSSEFGNMVTATAFIKSGGTSSQYLMADGSVSTGGGSGISGLSTNYIPKATSSTTIGNSNIADDGTKVGIATKLIVGGSVQVLDDITTPSSENGGALRYRDDGNNSYIDMCMRTGASTYEWVNIITHSW